MREPWRPWLGVNPCLLCLDLQRQPGGPAVRSDADGRIARCRQLLRVARMARWPLLHALKMEDQAQPRPIPGLEPLPFETVLFRQGPSAFSHRRMQELVLDVAADGLVVLAMNLDAACVATALRGHELGLRVALVEDTLSSQPVDGIAPEAAREVLLSMASPFVGRLTTTQLMGLALGPDQPQAANDCFPGRFND